ncbi:hypothetical protein SUGI_0810020 [Cryptomeria japonica]|nr:hypothetical protein SUGI_0810020 [Cryptomeria japonica]
MIGKLTRRLLKISNKIVRRVDMKCDKCKGDANKCIKIREVHIVDRKKCKCPEPPSPCTPPCKPRCPPPCPLPCPPPYINVYQSVEVGNYESLPPYPPQSDLSLWVGVAAKVVVLHKFTC